MQWLLLQTQGQLLLPDPAFALMRGLQQVKHLQLLSSDVE
jgi:hypothetical protein